MMNRDTPSRSWLLGESAGLHQVVADMDIGGVQLHVGELDVAQGPVAERGDPFVEAGTDP